MQARLYPLYTYKNGNFRLLCEVQNNGVHTSVEYVRRSNAGRTSITYAFPTFFFMQNAYKYTTGTEYSSIVISSR